MQAGVLESFLKGENNNPEERMKDMTIKLRNCFVFLIEEKITFKGAKDPRFIKLYSDCVCLKCKDFGSPVSPSKGRLIKKKLKDFLIYISKKKKLYKFSFQGLLDRKSVV